MLVPKYRRKAIQTLCLSNKVPTSKQQIVVYNLLKDLYGNCQLNIQCSNLMLDCVVNINDVQIDIEYDGWYWHQNQLNDRRRDEVVKTFGYKILRIKSGKNIPTIQ